jgi:predicted O-linked N-acetylglucosamine transferase (SPINDLY family)
LKVIGKPIEAIEKYNQALKIKPNYFEAYNNLGITQMELGQLDIAVKSFEAVLFVNSNYEEAYNNLGIVLNMQGKVNAAIKCYKKAINIKPNYAEAYSNLGNLMIDLKQLENAADNYLHAYELKPEIPYNLGNIIHTKMHLSDWNVLEIFIEKLKDKIHKTHRVIDPFSLLAIIDNPQLHQKAAEIYINDKYPKNHDLPLIKKYPRHKKIRIGYFSPDFRVHPVANLTAELYEIHDRSSFEVHAFSFGPDTNDEMNLRIKAGVDFFHDVQSMSHKEVALLSRSLELDIAIDLGGFTQDTRTEIFAMQAAPIQVNYLGYSSTMGAEYIDYIIADKILIPEDKRQHYSEKVVYMPDSFMVNDKSIRTFTREEMGLPNNGFIFSCFNHHYKITPSVFTGWMRILSKVDGSVLWLASGNKTGISNLRKEAEKNNIDGSRLIFATRLDLREDHLSRIKLADLFLDTLPYNAHATTSDALQVGLPVLTCVGESFASRVAASLINSVNLPELITNNHEEYEKLAIELATKPEKLKNIKEKLDSNLTSSPLYDTPLYVKQLEMAFEEMYERYQKKLKVEHIDVQLLF